MSEQFPEPEPPAPKRPLRPKLLLAAGGVVVLALVGVAAVAGDNTTHAEPKPLQIAGNITADAYIRPGDWTGEKDTPCGTKSGYSDIRAGTAVTITNDTQRVIAVGNLGSGVFTESDPIADCRFPFVIPDVPDAPFYGVEVGHRGVVRYTREQVNNPLVLTLG